MMAVKNLGFNIMTITDRLRLELFLREQLTKHGDEFYVELARLLERLQTEQTDDRGRPELATTKR